MINRRTDWALGSWPPKKLISGFRGTIRFEKVESSLTFHSFMFIISIFKIIVREKEILEKLYQAFTVNNLFLYLKKSSFSTVWDWSCVEDWYNYRRNSELYYMLRSDSPGLIKTIVLFFFMATINVWEWQKAKRVSSFHPTNLDVSTARTHINDSKCWE